MSRTLTKFALLALLVVSGLFVSANTVSAYEWHDGAPGYWHHGHWHPYEHHHGHWGYWDGDGHFVIVIY